MRLWGWGQSCDGVPALASWPACPQALSSQAGNCAWHLQVTGTPPPHRISRPSFTQGSQAPPKFSMGLSPAIPCTGSLCQALSWSCHSQGLGFSSKAGSDPASPIQAALSSP